MKQNKSNKQASFPQDRDVQTLYQMQKKIVRKMRKNFLKKELKRDPKGEDKRARLKRMGLNKEEIDFMMKNWWLELKKLNVIDSIPS